MRIRNTKEYIQSFDFTDKKAIKDFISLDKHARIEGICIEELFKEEFLDKENFEYINSLWIENDKFGRRIYKLLTDIDKYGESMHKILVAIRRLTKMQVIIASFCHDTKYYYCADVIDGLTRVEQVVYWKSKRFAFYPNDKYFDVINRIHDKERTQLALDYLEKKSLLKDVFIERYFVNFILKGYLQDIDFVLLVNNRLYMIEVKQKTPTYDGNYGLNEGLKEIYSEFEKYSIEVLHYILTKPVSNVNFSAIKLITEQPYKDSSLWIATKLRSEKLTSKSEAPSYTSIYGNSTVKYYKIPVKSFYRIGITGEKNCKKINELIENKCDPIRDIKDIPKISF